MEPQPLTAAERVAQLIKTLDISSYQFGKETGLSHQTISNVLTGKNRPSLDTLEAIAARYPDTAIWLLTGTGEPRTGRALSQLPPPVPSKLEEQPRPGYFRVTADTEELKQVKDERDNLRVQVNRLLDLLANSYGVPAAVGKAEASADAATNLYALVDRICVTGLIRYPEYKEEVDEAVHYDLQTGKRAA